VGIGCRVCLRYFECVLQVYMIHLHACLASLCVSVCVAMCFVCRAFLFPRVGCCYRVFWFHAYPSLFFEFHRRKMDLDPGHFSHQGVLVIVSSKIKVV